MGRLVLEKGSLGFMPGDNSRQSDQQSGHGHSRKCPLGSYVGDDSVNPPEHHNCDSNDSRCDAGKKGCGADKKSEGLSLVFP